MLFTGLSRVIIYTVTSFSIARVLSVFLSRRPIKIDVTKQVW